LTITEDSSNGYWLFKEFVPTLSHSFEISNSGGIQMVGHFTRFFKRKIYHV